MEACSGRPDPEGPAGILPGEFGQVDRGTRCVVPLDRRPARPWIADCRPLEEELACPAAQRPELPVLVGVRRLRGTGALTVVGLAEPGRSVVHVELQ